jgi:hypothetical protein
MASAQWTVVVVDDADDVRALVRTRLRLSGYFDVVGEGGAGIDAVELVRKHQPSLLVLDVSMPQMDGLEALPKVLAASPDTRVVMFSGFTEPGLAEHARALGAAAFLEKSASLDSVAEQLATVMGESRSSSAPVRVGLDDTPADRADPDEVLAQHLERFAEVFDNAAIGMATMTLTGQVVRANRALAGLLDQPVGALVGARYPGLHSAEQMAQLTALAQADVGERVVMQLEHLIGHEARARHLLAGISPVADSAGRPLYFFVQVQDVTAQRTADEALRQSEERFRLLVAAVEDYAIFMLDPNGVVVSWNAGAQRIKGYTASEIMGQHFSVFYPPEVRAAGHPEHELQIALRDGHYEEEGWRLRHDGRRFWAAVTITAIRGPAGQHLGFAKITRDVTSRQELLQERQDTATALAAANHELEQANSRLAQAAADQSQFLAVTAHELRTPVAVMRGSAQTLVDHWAALSAQERIESVAAMSASAERMSRMLTDLLTASRLQADAIQFRLGPLPLAELVARCVRGALTTRPEAEIEVRVASDLTVVADPEYLARGVDNLLGNALQHGRSPVLITAAERDGMVEVRFRDSGTGVSPQVRSRLFQQFSTGNRRGGTGLGLFIVRQLARAQGGDVWLDDPDRTRDGDTPSGASFALAVPAAPTFVR